MTVELRIALLLIGLVVLATLYFLGRYRQIARRKQDKKSKFESDDLSDPLGIDQTPELDADAPRSQQPTFRHQPSLLDKQESDEVKQEGKKLVILHVVARRPNRFEGINIVTITKKLGLEYDDMKIFHKNIERFSGKKSLYSIVNMVEPGTFDLDTIDEFKTPGLGFVMSLPGPEEGLKAFNIMLEAAKKFADELNGDLLDDARNRLSSQTIAHLQEEVQLFSLKYSSHTGTDL
jgi:cell division protein ZipA